MAISQPSYPVQTQNLVTHVGSYVDAQVAPKANTASPTFTGTPAAPTAAAGTSTTQVATTEFVAVAIAPTLTTKTTSYTPVLADANTTLAMDSASQQDFTIPPNASVAYPLNTTIEFARFGAGAVRIIAGSGVTMPNSIEEAGTTLRTITSRRQSVVATKIATNTWWLAGSLS